MVFVLKCNNNVVTDTYLEIIGSALNLGCKQNIKYINNVEEVYCYNKNTIIVVASIIDAYKLIKKGYKHIVMWFQGISPEESLMRHNNKIKYFILNQIEKKVLKKSEFCFFVSKKMKEHYQEKYKIKFKQDNFFIMPCLNTTINKLSFEDKSKYKNNYFAYIGSMEVWQNFDKTVSCYKSIESLNLKNCKLFVYTSEKEKAIDIINKYNVENYEVGYFDNTELFEELKKIKYGFILRDNIAVNNVATTTKISTYLSCGIIPIYSASLVDFANVAKKMRFAISHDNDMNKKIVEFNSITIKNNEVFNEYNNIFNTYYNKQEYIKNISKVFKSIYGEKNEKR